MPIPQPISATEARQSAIHPFEAAGLGKAPFRYVGIIPEEIAYGERVLGVIGGATVTTKPGGTCDYCGTYIIDRFRVESSDGRRFVVGCDCIHKVNDSGLARDIAGDRKKAKSARETRRIEAAVKALPDAHQLRSKPHPTIYRAGLGETLWHWCDFSLKHAGRTGKLAAARVVERAIAPTSDEN